MRSHLELTFEESTHNYFLDGMRIPSVSAIIQPIYNKVYGDISESTLNVAAERGTKIHRAIEFLHKYDYCETNEEIQGYIDGYQKFRKAYGDWDLKEAELRTYHKALFYGMTIDQVYDTPDGIVICDLKTPKIAHPKAWSVQLSAYKMGYESQHGRVSRIVALQLFSNGEYQLHELTDESKTFLACLQIYRYEVV